MPSKLLIVPLAAALALGAPAFAQQPAQPVRPAGAPQQAHVPLSFAELVERVSGAVVQIETRRPAEARPALPPGFPQIPGFTLPQRPGNDDAPQPEARGAGSGFFVSQDGYIVTAAHVIENATRITVTLTDQRELEARVIGRDEATDLAVLKVEGRGFPFVSFATTARPRVGDWVVAVGNPFGLGGTATAGIVSAYGRQLDTPFVDYLQIDAPINRGNSGGPTFDLQGRVIGVNTANISPTGGSVGIGFAIPAEVADATVRELTRSGRIVRGYIGAQVGTISREMAEALGIAGRRGALVTDITAGAPAAAAGLQVGDAVLSANGRPVDSSGALTRAVAATPPGGVLRLEVVRNGANRTVEIRTGTRPSEQALNSGGTTPQPGATPTPEGTEAFGGLSVRTATPAELRAAGRTSGVAVTRVASGSEASSRGLRSGDIIYRANTREVTSPADLNAVAAEARRGGRPSVLLFVARGAQSTIITLPLEAATAR